MALFRKNCNKREINIVQRAFRNNGPEMTKISQDKIPIYF